MEKHSKNDKENKNIQNGIVPVDVIENKIFIMRGQKVMIDRDLAGLYGTLPKALNQAVKRNSNRFPPDFMFQLTEEEAYQLVTKCDRFRTLKHSLKPPFAFTEQGIAMLSSVLKSERAVMVNIQIMRTFTKLREMLMSHQELKKKIEEMEKKYDCQFRVVFDAIKELIEVKQKPKRRIGFIT